jgi:hypothetical protein
MGRESGRAGVGVQVSEPDRGGVADQQAQDAPADRQRPDVLDGLGVHADVHELVELAIRADHAQGGVAGLDQSSCGLDDVLQDHGQAQVTGDGHVRPQQGTQSSLGVEHVLGPGRDIAEQFLQFQTGQVGKSQLREPGHVRYALTW